MTQREPKRPADPKDRAEGQGPSRRLRENILSSVGPVGRFEGFADRVARCLEIPLEAARSLLRDAEGEDPWRETRYPGVRVLRRSCELPGVRVVRAEPGASVPLHDHEVPEIAFCIQGGADQLNGSLLEPGDFEVTHPGRAHGYLSIADEPCILVLRRRGVDAAIAGRRPIRP